MLIVLSAALLYFAAALWLAVDARREAAGAGRRGWLLPADAAVLLHGLVHYLAWRSSGATDLHFFAALSLVGLGMAALTALVAATGRMRALGVVVFPLAALVPGAGVRRMMDDALFERGVAPQLQYEVSHGELLRQLVAAGLAVAAIPDSMAARMQDVDVRPLAEPFRFRTCVAWRADPTPAARALLDLLPATTTHGASIEPAKVRRKPRNPRGRP